MRALGVNVGVGFPVSPPCSSSAPSSAAYFRICMYSWCDVIDSLVCLTLLISVSSSSRHFRALVAPACRPR
eukprot:5932253-Pyramimonas_sp.AAC.1